MIGIIAAKDCELELIKERMATPVCERHGAIDFVRGTLEGRDAVIAVCGVGKVFAAMCAEAMVIEYSPEFIINTGVGGTLTPRLSIGDVAIASRLCQHDMDTSAVGDEVGLVSGINKVYFDADAAAVEKLSEAAAEIGIATHVGVIASGDKFIAEKADKERITSVFGASVCEMEGAAIAQVCFVNGIPFAVCRAISDNADGTSCDDFPSFIRSSAANSAELVCRFLRKF